MNKVLHLFIRAALVLCSVSLLLGSGFARERGPRVEVVCPSPPIPVTVGATRVLVYELHVTNFDTVPLTLKQIQVFARDNVLLSTLDGDMLSAAMTRVGSPMMMSSGSHSESVDARTINPGGRNVIFMWVELLGNRPGPESLRHRMTFSSTPAAASAPIDSTLEDFLVTVSQDSPSVLSPPFHEGIWVAGDGPDNQSNHRRSIFAIDGCLYSPERFAIDWVKVGPNGDSRHDGKTKNENSWDWGEPVLAVSDGDVREVVDEFPDNTPGDLPPVTLDNIAGNHIILQIATNRFVTYAHLQKGSLKVRVGDHVHRGDTLALLGNSGNSTGPHLHLQVTDRNSVLQSQGVPFVFSGFTYLGPGSEYPEKQVSVPFSNSIPPGDGVLKFEPISR